jgi:spore coat protein A
VTFLKENYELPEENDFTKETHCTDVNPSLPGTIPKFVDVLPIPKVLSPDRLENGYAYYEIEMKAAMHKFHRDFDETLIYGYNGLYPGPTIEAIKCETIYVKWVNNLPSKHFLPVDKSIHGAIDNPEVRSVVHLHGANVAPDSDGHPDAWFTRDYDCKGPKFCRKVYEYPNDQQATTLWYHDHSLGTTRLNVYAGLAGFYIIHDFQELSLNLPKDKYDIPLIIQDKSFKEDSSLAYPSGPPNGPVFPSIVRAFIGDTMVVNGKVWPYLKVEPRKYRFRILNASNTNGYVMKLSNGDPFIQIGTDGGLLTKPVTLTSFPLDPAERIDVIIDFSKYKSGDKIILNTEENDLKSDVMEFIVTDPCYKSKDTSVIPKILRPIDKLDKEMAVKTRRFVIGQDLDFYKRVMLSLNHRMFSDPATEKPEYDSIEIWEFANTLTSPVLAAHPIHLHLVQFQILNRQLFDLTTFKPDEWIEKGTGIDYYPDIINPDPSEGGPVPPEKPDEAQRAWKDTVRVEPGTVLNGTIGSVTRIIVHFDNHTGEYVWHCHILEHEDHDMMRPLIVVKKYFD